MLWAVDGSSAGLVLGPVPGELAAPHGRVEAAFVILRGMTSQSLAARLSDDIARLAGLVDDWQEARRSVDEIVAYCKAEGLDELDAEQARYVKDMWAWQRRVEQRLDRMGIPRGEAGEALDEMRQRLDQITATEESRAAALASAERYGGTKLSNVRVGREAGPYYKGGQHSFFADMLAMRLGDPTAGERIMGHQRGAQLEARDAAASAFAGLVVPQYLTDHFAPVARQGRPFADFVAANGGGFDLPPDGMTLNVPRGNTGTLVLSQTTENTAVAEQDMANVDIVVPVVTIAGQHDMSRQAMDRGRNTDMEVMQDLAEAYATELDRQSLNGSGANNQHLGLLSTTNVTSITCSSTSGITQVRQIAGAVSRVHSNRFMPANVIVVHPRRWAYWSQAVDSSGRPIVTPEANGPQNAFGLGDLGTAKGIVGTLYGILPVLADPNLPTTLSFDVTQSSTTDPIIVTRTSDLRLFENSPVPRRVRFEETLAGSLTVKIVAFDYSAWTGGRYSTATVVLSGSGLTTPQFGTG